MLVKGVKRASAQLGPFRRNFCKQRRRQNLGRLHCPGSSNFQIQISTLCWSLLVIFLVSNIAVLYSAQNTTVCRAGMDRDPEFCFYWSKMLRDRNLSPPQRAMVRHTHSSQLLKFQFIRSLIIPLMAVSNNKSFGTCFCCRMGRRGGGHKYYDIWEHIAFVLIS